jgi:hypothetical protein
MSQAPEPSRFSGLDAFILAVFSGAGLLTAIENDRVFFDMLQSLASHQEPWPSLPGWVADLELPAKRVRWGFLAFLSIVSVGIGLSILRGTRQAIRNGLPGPGIAAGVAAAIAVIEQTLERICLAAQDGLLAWPAFVRTRFDMRKWSPYEWNTGPFWFEAETAVTAAILGVWSYLILARAWKARDGWRDWLGRWLAWCWLGQIPAQVAIVLLWG